MRKQEYLERNLIMFCHSTSYSTFKISILILRIFYDDCQNWVEVFWTHINKRKKALHVWSGAQIIEITNTEINRQD